MLLLHICQSRTIEVEQHQIGTIHRLQLFQFYNQNFATVDIRILQKFKTEKQTTAAIVHIDKSMLPLFFPIDMS